MNLQIELIFFDKNGNYINERVDHLRFKEVLDSNEDFEAKKIFIIDKYSKDYELKKSNIRFIFCNITYHKAGRPFIIFVKKSGISRIEINVDDSDKYPEVECDRRIKLTERLKKLKQGQALIIPCINNIERLNRLIYYNNRLKKLNLSDKYVVKKIETGIKIEYSRG